MTVPTVAFFGSLIAEGTPRGALRLFRAIAGELALREDVELICLGDPAFDPSDPVGCTYECFDGREFLVALEAGNLANFLETQSPSRVHQPLAEMSAQERWHVRLEELMSLYRRKVPYPIRRQLAGTTRRLRRVLLRNATSPAGSAGSGIAALRPPIKPRFPETLFAIASRDRDEFSNRDVVGRVISLDKIDVLLNFWWFHSPHGNPLVGRYRPRGLRVVSWFLDAIPLRVAHWQPGMIPVPEFRPAIQTHLEMADEIVAISRSAAEDVRTFFPHLRKPIHVVPCGLFDQDFEPPGFVDSFQRNLSLDTESPLFTIIGFQEPSKNVPNALRGLVKVAHRLGRKLQVFIIGHGSATELDNMLGPVAAELEGRVRLIFAAQVSEVVKRAALSRSTALIYPSKWEGFGIPPLEAMAIGTPVVAGDIPPLREVCADLAEYCDPYDVESVAAAIMRTLSRPASEMIRYTERAREHARGYMWKAAVDQLQASVLTSSGAPMRRSASWAEPARQEGP